MDSPHASRLLELAEQYAAAGNPEMEARCRYLRAQYLGHTKPSKEEPERMRDTFDPSYENQKERAEGYEHAAALFDATGSIKEAGRCWYMAAKTYNRLALLHPEYREQCYAVCDTAADRFEAAGDWWGKGVAEFLAGHTPGEFGSPPDLRDLQMLRRSVKSFTRAGRPVELATSLMSIAVLLTGADSDEEWMAAGIRALHSYEEARPSLQMPHDREQNDHVIIDGARVLTSRLVKAAPTIGDTPQWAELAWLLEQAAKARSFQDQHLQDEVWSSLVADDETLTRLMRKKYVQTREHDGLSRKINTAALTQKITDETRTQGEELKEIEKELDTIRRQVHDRFRELARTRPDRVELVSAAPVSPDELRECLNPGEAYLGYRWNDGRPLRTLVTRTGFSAALAEGVVADYAKMAAEAARHGETLHDTDPDDAAQLIGPIPDGIDTLIISPHLLLVGVPWHLLPCPSRTNPNQTLGDLYTIAIVPAAGVLRHLRNARSRSQPVVRDAAYLGVACDGSESKKASTLKCVDGEVKAIARDYFAGAPRSRCLTTSECHKFIEDGCSVRLLHLSCHAERNGLLLSHNDTWTTPIDLLNQHGRTFGADIILLTGCYTGDFSEQENNEFLGIVRQLLLVTGARSAIASTAQIRDAAAPVFADLVVSALTGRNPDRPWQTPMQPLAVGPAVTWARRTLRNLRGEDVKPLIPNPHAASEPEDPIWWSPWFVIGDPHAKL